jgi:uroporphyrinogen-III synthase
VVIGETTAEVLREFNITPRWFADPTTSEGMLQLLKTKYELRGKKILFPRSSLPNPYLKSELTRLGAEVRELTIYQNIKPQVKAVDLSTIGKVIFTSPSTVKNFLETFGTIPDHWQILSKGPATNQTLQQAGYESEVLIHE